ncbi:hypothetical protein BBJ28_00015516 [Nothophytophthora sp. Chile5]|nr:hypothetical protein BBJ28_00015516 [Nothophytophthora sp. Chile5]
MDGIAESLHVEIVTPLLFNETIRQAATHSFRLAVEITDTANFYTPYPIWTSDVSQQALSTDLRQFQTQLDIRINPVDVIYRPQWPEGFVVVITAYACILYREMQYYCIMVVVSALVAVLREFLFKSKVRIALCLFPGHCIRRYDDLLRCTALSSPRQPRQWPPDQSKRKKAAAMSSKEEATHEEEEIDLDDLLEGEAASLSAQQRRLSGSGTTSPLEIASVQTEAAATTSATEDNEADRLQENAIYLLLCALQNMNKFLEDAQNPEFQQVLEQAFRELGTDADGENIEQLLGSLKTDTTPDETDDVNAGVAKTLQNMAKAAEDMEGMGTAQVENMGEEMMSEMMKKFEEMGEKSDFQDLVDGMMQQLLSKDVMYDPMKQICERVRTAIVPYGKQYQYFQQIVAMYESEPDNFARLSELMQEMQETGQPPSEIVKDLAPGSVRPWALLGAGILCLRGWWVGTDLEYV